MKEIKRDIGTTIQDCYIVAKPLKEFSLRDSFKDIDPLLKLLLWLIACGFTYIVMITLVKTNNIIFSDWVWISPIITWTPLLLLIFFLIEYLRLKKLARTEAETVTAEVRSAYTNFFSILQNMNSITSALSRDILESESNFLNFTSSSFWQQIDSFLLRFDSYNRQLEWLSREREIYYELIEGRNHNFPPLTISKEMLPRIDLQIINFNRIVRMGQRNLDLPPIIWEHRKSQVVGYKNFRDAVENIGYTLDRTSKELLAVENFKPVT